MGFEQIDEISIVCSPDEAETMVHGLRSELIDHCEKLKDRFAILQESQQSSQAFEDIRIDIESKYAAVYIPWIWVSDPFTRTTILVPPGGHVAGIYARSDIQRGVHKAPANEVVRGATSLQLQLTKEQQTILNPRGINIIRSFPGRGIVVYGARTISRDPNWKYINVRRLSLFIEKSIQRSTQSFVFEPNSETLWSRVIATITIFLSQLRKNGALMGKTDEEAFFVKCDRTTMTQDDIDNGRLIVIVGFAPVQTAEFVIFRIAQTKAEGELQEL
jgi:phage tail sheath protein FI